ncbi:hypothetical protein LCGC14_2567760, partial [marine sediment metagenome]
MSREAEELACKFHQTYERLAPDFGYETREASAKPWNDVPENNRKLMTAVCAELLDLFAVVKIDKLREALMIIVNETSLGIEFAEEPHLHNYRDMRDVAEIALGVDPRQADEEEECQED